MLTTYETLFTTAKTVSPSFWPECCFVGIRSILACHISPFQLASSCSIIGTLNMGIDIEEGVLPHTGITDHFGIILIRRWSLS